MFRSLLLMAACVLWMGGSCNPALLCTSPLDGTEFGFTLSVPDGFVCSSSLPQSGPILGLVIYDETGTGVQLIVFVGDASSADELVDDGTSNEGDCDDIGAFTNSNGVEFERCMSTQDGVSYAASTNLPEGEAILLIIMVAETDPGDLEEALNTVLETVAFPVPLIVN